MKRKYKSGIKNLMNLGFYLELLYHIADTAIEVIMDVPLHRKHAGMENMLPPPVIPPTTTNPKC